MGHTCLVTDGQWPRSYCGRSASPVLGGPWQTDASAECCRKMRLSSKAVWGAGKGMGVGARRRQVETRAQVTLSLVLDKALSLLDSQFLLICKMRQQQHLPPRGSAAHVALGLRGSRSFLLPPEVPKADFAELRSGCSQGCIPFQRL